MIGSKFSGRYGSKKLPLTKIPPTYIDRCVKNPAIILADEPTGNLDAGTAYEVLELLTYLATENGSTVLVATHDYNLLASKNGRLIEIDDGRLVS